MREGGWRRPPAALVLAAILGLEAVAVLALAAAGASGDGKRTLPARRTLVAELRLTDLALWPDASYCRHPSQADLFAPHAYHPAAPEHLPAGSIVPPKRDVPALGAAAPGAGGKAALP